MLINQDAAELGMSKDPNPTRTRPGTDWKGKIESGTGPP